MPHEDRDYYRARASEERDRASSATDPAIAAIHFALASNYEELVARLGNDDATASGSDRPPAFDILAAADAHGPGEPGMAPQ